jgi:hypothetical protein
MEASCRTVIPFSLGFHRRRATIAVFATPTHAYQAMPPDSSFTEA